MGPKDSPDHAIAPKPGGERRSVHNLRRRPHPKVLVVGGGINGVVTFRDLALQGVDVALVERGDYCQGASGASSHMIHGGIRYFENGGFRLVRESVVERNRLLRIAPHYVKPLQTTIPVFSTFPGILAAPLRFLTHKQQAKPKERGAFLIKVGLRLYDAFPRDGGTVRRHQFRSRKRALAELPRLRQDIKYAATYFDASVHNPERLTLDVLEDGEKAGQVPGAANTQGSTARASNYLSLTSISGEPNRGTGKGSTLRLRDELTGGEFDFTADVIINTTGAWADLTNESMGTASALMGGTKGSHIVLDHPALLDACRGRESSSNTPTAGSSFSTRWATASLSEPPIWMRTDEAGVQKWIKEHMAAGRDADRTAGLLTHYGTRAEAVIAYLDAAPDHLLRSTRELSVREMEFMAAHEQGGHLVDVIRHAQDVLQRFHRVEINSLVA